MTGTRRREWWGKALPRQACRRRVFRPSVAIAGRRRAWQLGPVRVSR
jgi:hypothetical protein